MYQESARSSRGIKCRPVIGPTVQLDLDFDIRISLHKLGSHFFKSNCLVAVPKTVCNSTGPEADVVPPSEAFPWVFEVYVDGAQLFVAVSPQPVNTVSAKTTISITIKTRLFISQLSPSLWFSDHILMLVWYNKSTTLRMELCVFYMEICDFKTQNS